MNSFRIPTPVCLLFIAVAVAAAAATLLPAILANDSLQYYTYGQNLVENGIYGSILGEADQHREPGYGLFVGAAFQLIRLLSQDGIPSVSAPEAQSVTQSLIFFQLFTYFLSIFLFWRFSPLKSSMKTIYSVLLAVSPTAISAATEVYPETIALTCFNLFLLWATRALQAKPKIYDYGIAGLLWGYLILTKMYLKYTLPLFLVLGIWLYIRNRKQSVPRLAYLFLTLAIVGKLTLLPWDIRNQILFPEQKSSFRMNLALAGKMLKIEGFTFPADVAPALANAIGGNLCNRIFDPARCFKLSIKNSDGIGIDYWTALERKHGGDQSAAQRELYKNLATLYLQSPLLHLFGSMLEVVSISFLESIRPITPNLSPLHWIPPIWHFFGSLLVLLFTALGIRRFWKLRREQNDSRDELSTISVFLLTLIAYHYATMAQISNIVRYSFVLIPIFYWFIALELSARRCRITEVK